jgi:hypothetical protein
MCRRPHPLHGAQAGRSGTYELLEKHFEIREEKPRAKAFS